MNYQFNDSTAIKEAMWNEKTCVRCTGGYVLDKANLTGVSFVPKGALLALVDGKAVVVKTAKVYETAASSATSVKVEKNSVLAVGDTVGSITITAIDRTNALFDVLTVTGNSAGLNAGTVLVDANASKACGLNYATVYVDQNPTCTYTIQAYEIEEATLPTPVNAEIKTALTARHMFI